MNLFDTLFKGTEKTTYYNTSDFGMRTIKGVTKMHRGVDWGTHLKKVPIYSFINGAVLNVYPKSTGGSLGNYIYIKDNKYVYQMAHLDRYVVSKGQQIKVGDLLGYVGNTGGDYGIHLHFGVFPVADWGKDYYERAWFNPLDLLKEDIMSTETIYTVKKGDVLWKIAQAHDVSLDELIKYNNFTQTQASNIKVGQPIKIPKKTVLSDFVSNPSVNTINDLTRQIEVLKQEIITYKATCNKYTDEMGVLNEQTWAFKNEVDVLSHKLNTQTIENDKLRAIVGEKDALILSYKKEINDRVKIFIAPKSGKFVIGLKDKDELFIKRTY
jgi:murein DD-endopeptidase MepM/ murein hydrolase activator NlpD